MTNKIIIMLDTEQVESIKIGKSGPVAPQTMEELRNIMLLDVATLCEALAVLIKECANQGIKSEGDSLCACINHITAGVFDAKSMTETRISVN